MCDVPGSGGAGVSGDKGSARGLRLPRLRSLRTRFLVALVLVGILPLGLVGLGLAALDRQAIEEQSTHELTGLAQGLAGQVNAQLAAVLSESQVVAALPEIVSMDGPRQAALLRELYLQHPGFARLAVFDVSGRLSADSHPDDHPTVAESASFLAVQRRGVQAWEVARAPGTGRASVLVYTPIRADDERPAGALLAALAAVVLARMLTRPVRELALAAQAFENGDPDAPLPTGAAHGSEIGMLVAAFAAIRRTVAAALARTRLGEERFRKLAENASDVVAIVADDGHLRYVSSSVSRVWGYPAEALLGRTALDLVAPEDVEAARQLLEDSRRSPGMNLSVDLRIRRADQSWREFEIIMKNLLQDEAVAGSVVTYHDVTERKRFEQQLAHQAFHDPLTKLPNRALFMDRPNQAVERVARRGTTLAVMFLDLDNFKLVNDTLGHARGDDLLVAVAERIRPCLRPADTLARLGGDEFTVILEDLHDGAEAARVAERIAQALGTPFSLDGQRLFTGVSIGIALSDAGHTRSEDLLHAADVAMYHAKAAGKGRHAVFDPGWLTQSLDGDKRQAGGEAVQVGGRADWADLAVAEQVG